MKKLFLFFALIIGLLASASTAMAQTVNMDSYITLTVKNGAAIKLNFQAAADGTPVRIVSGSTDTTVTVGTGWTGTASYTAGSTTMTVYGDIIGFGCKDNVANLTALNVSNNTELRWLYCYGNAFSTAALNDIYCSLPNRIGKDNGEIQPVFNSSSSNYATVKATNAQNAIDKNWWVRTKSGNDITTNGTYVCPPTTTYDLEIAGVQVTSANCSDLSVISGVSGTVKYDPTNKVLTLDGATIQINTTIAIDSKIDGLTIKVIGTNNLTEIMSFYNSATITGGGTLNVETQNNLAIFANETNLTIDGCTVNAKGKYGIAGWNGSSETLTIKNSTVTAEGTAGSIADFASLSMIGCSITQPAGAAFDASLKAVALGGSVVTSKVVISPTQPNMDSYITLTVAKDSAIKLDFMAAAAGTPVRIVSGTNTQNITVGTGWYNGHTPSTYTVTANASTMTIYGDITVFDCQKNEANLTALDPSHNTQLTELGCSNNQLTSLDVSGCTQLTKLSCYSNKLTNLNVSGCTKLDELWCYRNTLNSLDVSGCTQLTWLSCHDNKLSTDALDDIYCALPDRKDSINGVIQPVDNSSSTYNDTVIASNAANATAKNWKVQYFENKADIATTGTYDCSTAVAEAAAEPALTLYPNPVADVLYLSATARTVRIYNVYGTEVAHATDTDRVEVSHLPAGVYTVKADGSIAKMVKR